MAGEHGTHRRTIASRPKVKTGCATCRIRKVKCDERKPSCQKCVGTGRTCDGYEFSFRSFVGQTLNPTRTAIVIANIDNRSLQPGLIGIGPQDIELLNRYFSTKTLLDVKLSCIEEAKKVLHASLTDPIVQHAITSLRALREDLEISGDDPSVLMQLTPRHHYGLEQYSIALGGLASNLSSPSPTKLKSTLHCCQIFICIEQVRKNYSAMAQHIIRGLGIMREYRARPVLVASDKLLPAYHDQLPLLDIFVIKLFAAPCKFTEPLAADDLEQTISSSGYSSVSNRNSNTSLDLRDIAPDMRTGLTKIAALTLKLLDKVSSVESVEQAIELLTEKAFLLDSLDSWFADFESVHSGVNLLDPEPISASFLRILHLVLQLVVLGTLESSTDLNAKLRAVNEQLQEAANNVGERVKTYVTCTGAKGVEICASAGH